MCGIAGKIYFQQKELTRERELPLIQKTLEKLYHRGPDDSGYIIDKNIWLGATRLAIIDLSPSGHQPMKNEDDSLFLVFNGEIYNYKELKRKLRKRHKFISQTDSEVVLHLYEENGIDCLKFLRGMFTFAIWDSKRSHLFLARDRLGKKPLKYYYNDKFLIFASELKAFIDHPGVPKEIDWAAVDEFIAYQYVPPPKTGFMNIWKLPPAHFMMVNADGRLKTHKYWDLDFGSKLHLAEPDWKENILSKLTESIKLRLKSDVPLGIHLSGGIDSSIITALASKISGKPLNTFSIGFTESDYSELPYARSVAERYKTKHHEFIVKEDVLEQLPQLIYQYEEPIADPSILPTWELMKQTKQFVKVVLNGDGGDENFAGYPRYKIMQIFNFLKLLPFKNKFSNFASKLYQLTKKRDLGFIIRLLMLNYTNHITFYQDLVSFIDGDIRARLYNYEFKKILKRVQDDNVNTYLIDKFKTIENLDILDQILSIDINTYLPNVLLVKADIASMAHSLEIRSPFVDHEFMELTSKMPSRFKLCKLQSKFILKKIAAYNLPSQSVNRRKQGFLPPLEHWFRGQYYDYVKSIILDKQFLSAEILNKKAIKNIIEDHKNFRANNAYIIWTFICLRHWLKTWFNL